MKNLDEIVARMRLTPGKKVRLKDHNPAWDGDDDIPEAERRELAARVLAESVEELAAAQELLYASDHWAILVILQGIDASGKDGTIKHVMSGVNPQGVTVTSFKQPSAEELDHTFLWRCVKALPRRGEIGIFNRSYYEEVLVVKVHPELVSRQRIPNADPSRKKFWKARYEDINQLERHLSRNGVRIVKFFLHLSQEEQRLRFLERTEKPEKNWKFSAQDLAERARWDDYQRAYEDMLTATTTKWAPWYVIPADRKWITRAAVAHILATEIAALDLKFPEVSAERRAEIEACRQKLLAEAK
jgi:PPK2 family polyphosphate:nucleotide phosphotransferase